MTKDTDSSRVNSVMKALRVLECFNSITPEMTLTQLSRELDMPKSTLLNLLRTLEEAGYVYRVRQSQNYRLGYKIMELGYSMRSAFPVIQFALPLMEELQSATGEFIYLTTHVNGRVLYLECVYPQKRTVGYSITGKTLPMHCTGCGKAMLSYMTEEEVLRVIARHGLRRCTPNTIVEPEALMEELRASRERGFAIDNEEETLGVRCVATAIRNAQGRPVGAISIQGTTMSMTDACIREYATLTASVSTILAEQAHLFPAQQLSQGQVPA